MSTAIINNHYKNEYRRFKYKSYIKEEQEAHSPSHLLTNFKVHITFANADLLCLTRGFLQNNKASLILELLGAFSLHNDLIDKFDMVIRYFIFCLITIYPRPASETTLVVA